MTSERGGLGAGRCSTAGTIGCYLECVLRVLWKLLAGTLLCLSMTAATAHALRGQQIGNFEKPIYLASDPGNPERLLVVERRGTIVVLEGGQLNPFADLRSKISEGEEGGLLSIALAPDF